MKSRFLILLFKLTIISWFLFLGFILFELFWPIKIYEYKTYPIPIVEDVIHRGDTIHFVTDYCKYIGSSANITLSLRRKLTIEEVKQNISDISIIFLTYHNQNTPMGCHSVVRELHIPTTIMPREYQMVQDIDGYVNFLRPFNLEYISEWFTVL